MPSKGGLIYHLTCLLYVPYLGKLQDPENHKHISKGASFLRINKVTCIVFVHNFCQSHTLTISG